MAMAGVINKRGKKRGAEPGVDMVGGAGGRGRLEFVWKPVQAEPVEAGPKGPSTDSGKTAKKAAAGYL